MIHTLKEDINLVGEFYWTECSDALKSFYEKNGGVKIPNKYIELFIDNYIIYLSRVRNALYTLQIATIVVILLRY